MIDFNKIVKIIAVNYVDSDFITKVVTEGICKYYYVNEMKEDEQFELTAGYSEWTNELEPVLKVNTTALNHAIFDDYFDLTKSIHGELSNVITKIDVPKVISTNGAKFKMLWTVHSNTPLSDSQRDVLINFIASQCKDGWGADFEKIPFTTFKDEQHYAFMWSPICKGPEVIEIDEALEAEELHGYDTPTPKYPNLKVKLIDEDGNTNAILNRVVKALKEYHVPKQYVEEFIAEAKSGDYSVLIQACFNWVSVY